MALDPFHDFAVAPAGAPDQYAGSSVVQFLKKRVQIARPAGIAGDWDCHISTLPLLTTDVGRVYTSVTPATAFENFATAGSIGTLNVFSVPAGTNSYPIDGSYSIPANSSYNSYSPCDDGNAYSLMRIVGGGFEVHNDTAELYRKGAVCVYSQPTEIQSRLMQLSYSAAGNPGVSTSALSLPKVCRSPPGNVSLANANITARNWEAKDGCYVPFQLDTTEMGFQQATADPLLAVTVDSSLGYTIQTGAYGNEVDFPVSITWNPLTGGVPAGSQFATACRSNFPTRFAGLETVGAYFTGLGPETTLTLDIRFIVEIAPTPNNTTLISLASPSAGYDPVALQLYAKAVRELPPGVKVNMNAAGDWWRVVSKAIQAVSPVLGALGPYGKAAQVGLGGINALGNAVLERKLDKRIKEVEANERAREKEKLNSSGKVKRAGPSDSMLRGNPKK